MTRISPLCLLALTTTMFGQPTPVSLKDGGQKVSVGSYSLFLNCTGSPQTAGQPAVILLSGGNRTATTWEQAQPGIAKFARVCSYDRMGEGQSDQSIPVIQSTGEVVEDLHSLLLNAGVKPPYILVGHSIGGLYARKFTESYASLVSGLVFVDSADEEQVWRFEKISHVLLFEYHDYPNWTKLYARGFLPPDDLLKWHDDVPLIVLEHGMTWPRGTFKGLTEDQYTALKATWHSMQLDLASRSKYGELRIAEKSGHFIQNDQPEVVVQAVHDVLPQSQHR